MCRHILVDGLGMMGDALTCIKCGYSFYPMGTFVQVYRLLGYSVLSCDKYPWLINAANKAIEDRERRESER